MEKLHSEETVLTEREALVDTFLRGMARLISGKKGPDAVEAELWQWEADVNMMSGEELRTKCREYGFGINNRDTQETPPIEAVDAYGGMGFD